METQALLYTDLPGVPLLRRGKIRDIYDVGEQLLIVASDRISAFDIVMPNGIPDKGKILTALSLFWFDLLRDVTPNHVIETDVARFPEPLPNYADQLAGRSMLVVKAHVLPVECMARGYVVVLSGAGWQEYHERGTISGIPLPPDLAEAQQLADPIFTPTTKAQTGHDENITLPQAAEIVGEDLLNEIRDRSLAIYRRAGEYARERGMIIADTKFEFGTRKADGGPADVLLIDEVLTPDSSRFWDMAAYQPGRVQDSFDKQPLREYLRGLGWNMEPPAPELPPAVVAQTRDKYLEAYRRLVGEELAISS
jgi:phosphoribosylaminoimidazole-succinocarboxamide synthase